MTLIQIMVGVAVASYFSLSLHRRVAMLGIGICVVATACGGNTPPAAAPQFMSAASVTFTVGTSGKATITTSDPAAKITESGAMPPGLSLTTGAGDAVVSGNPKPDSGGLYAITLTAHAAGGTASQHEQITVNEAPAFASSDTIWGVAFKYNNSPIKVWGYPIPKITESGTLPRGLQFTASDDGTARIFGSPELCPMCIVGTALGGSTVTLTASNSVGTATQTLQFNITGGGA